MKFRQFIAAVILSGFLSDAGAANTDTLPKVLGLYDFINAIKVNHPMAKAAELTARQGEAYVLKARGAFDPKLSAGDFSKQFEDKLYYNFFSAELKVPLWTGMNVFYDFDAASGVSLNPDDKLPSQGLSALGIEIPVLRNLIYDQRRFSLQSAFQLRDANDAQRQQRINQLLFEAIGDYAEWQKQRNILSIYTNAATVARERLSLVKEAVVSGDRPAIDSVELSAQLGNITLIQRQSLAAYIKAFFKISSYIWLNDGTPAFLSENVVPDSGMITVWADAAFRSNSLEQLQNAMETSHPLLRQLKAEQNIAGLDQKLKKEFLKPELNLKAALLSPGAVSGNSFSTAYAAANNKLGFSFSVPVLLRKERGDYKISSLKYNETQLKLKAKTYELSTKVNGQYRVATIYREQMNAYLMVQEAYKQLLEAENEKFRVGDSNAFMVNSREMKLLEVREKMIDLEYKWISSVAELLYLSGTDSLGL